MDAVNHPAVHIMGFGPETGKALLAYAACCSKQLRQDVFRIA